MHENIHSFCKFFEEFHSFGSELCRAADVIVLSETWFSAKTCHDVRGYTSFHTYRADKTGGGVSRFIRNCYTSTYKANFSVSCILWDQGGKGFTFKQLYCNYYCVYRPPGRSKIPEFTINWMKFCHQLHNLTMLVVGDLNINLLDPIAIENDFINNCRSNSFIPLINKPTRNDNNNPRVIDHIWTNQLYDTFNCVFLLDITDHYPIFT